LAEELFYCPSQTHYYLNLNNFFQQKLAKDELEVRFKFIQVFHSLSIEKEFFIQEFLSSYSSVISNQRKASIKKYFIEVIELLQNYDLIEDNYRYMSQGKIYKTSKLDVKNISEGFILYEKLNI
jgi:hypothetical protein